MVIGFIADPSDRNAPHNLASTIRVCRVLREEGLSALYRRVSVGPSVTQISRFLDTVSDNKPLACAMRSLSLDVPDVAHHGPPLPAAVRSLIGDRARNTKVAPVDEATLQSLRPSMDKMFRHAVNLVELDFPALEDFPGVLYAASFRLRALTTTGMGFGSLHIWENRPPPAPNGDQFALYTPIAKLQPLRSLDLNMKGIWCSADSLHGTFRRYHITHLTLRGASGRFVGRDLLPLMCHQLVSFKLVLAQRESAFWSRWHLWPTQILGEVKLPLLKHLEIDESEHEYLRVSMGDN